MGVDFTAILDHHLDPAGAADLPARLAAAEPALAPVLTTLRGAYPVRPDDGRWRWEMDPATFRPGPEAVAATWSRGELLVLEGPAGLSLDVQRAAVIVGHPARWGLFLRDAAIHEPLRRACRAVGAILGSTRAIYLPDSAYQESAALEVVWDGGGVAAVEAWLRQRVGPPAPTLASIVRTRDDGQWASRGYSIDRFTAQGRPD